MKLTQIGDDEWVDATLVVGVVPAPGFFPTSGTRVLLRGGDELLVTTWDTSRVIHALAVEILPFLRSAANGTQE